VSVAAVPSRSTSPPFLAGVDAVALERAGELLAEFGDALAARVATPAEAAWAGRSAVRMATLLAVKEAAVKCLAGRPPGFRWQWLALDAGGGVPGVPELPEGVAAALAAFGAAGVRAVDGPDAGTGLAVRVTGPGLDRARTLLGAAPGAAVRGVARRGTLDGHVLAVVALWEDRDA
jgi:hypothetical protein